MIGKLLLKLVVKASLPLIALAGIFSYGLYLKGGDPLSMWSNVASRAVGSIRENGANTVQSMQALKSEALSGSSSTSVTTAYTWVDSTGTTHFGSSPPAGVAAKVIHIRPNSPMTSPTGLTPTADTAPKADTPPKSAAVPKQAVQNTEQTQKLPGMAGVKLPVNIQPQDLGLTREQLLDMLGQ